MPEPYSNDLRRKFFEVYDRGDGSLKELAKRFRVSESWAKKLSARRSKTGQIEIRRWRHGPESRVTAAVRDWIREQLGQQPDLTLEELQQRLEQGPRLRLSLSWIWVLLPQLGLRLKKNRSTPRSRIAKKPSGAGKPGSKKLPR